MKKLTYVFSLFFIIALISGCSNGINVNGQKQIDFSFKQTGSNENWEVVDKISGTYYNIEQLISSTHSIEIDPRKTINYNQITVSIKVGDELLTINGQDANSKHKFTATLTRDGVYIAEQGLFTRFDDNEKFWDERIVLIIQHGDITEEVTLK